MKSRLLIICIIASLLFAIILYYLQTTQSAVHTFKYFPLDEQLSFVHTNTDLHLGKDDTIHWHVNSTADQPMYLRQDASLLYANGFFKGVQSKWQQNVKEIDLNETLTLQQPSMLEAISFHHGEIHRSEDVITSIQQMTASKLYIAQQQKHLAPIEPEDATAKTLQKKTNETMMNTWQRWIASQDIDEADYQLFPLSQLVDFNEKALPGLTDAQSKTTIGQLWEGLYKNYILRLKEQQNQTETHVMPVILLSNDATHLYVLYELNGEQGKLLQQIPNNETSNNKP